MKKTFVFALFFVFTNFLFSQENDLQFHEIKLIDGSKYVGEIIEEKEQVITLLMFGKTTKEFQRKDVQKIEQYLPTHYFFSNGYSFRNKGSFHTFSMHINPGSSLGQGIHFTKGYFIRSKLGLSLGIDYTSFGFSGNTFVFIPVYAQIKHYPFDLKYSPYYSMDIGWGFNGDLFGRFGEGIYESGLMMRPAIGIRKSSRRKIASYIELSFTLQKTYTDYQIIYENTNLQIIGDINFRRIGIGGGIIF